MVGTGKYRQTGAVWLLIILCGVGLACLALPETAAGQTTTHSEGATEIKVAPGEVILETESITDTMGITTSEDPPLDEGGASPVWKSTYTGNLGDNYPTAMTAKRVGGQDYVYVAGRTKDPANDKGWDYLTIKYQVGNDIPVWVMTYDGGAKGFDEARAIAVDSQGNVYVTGYSTGDGTGADFATIKYSHAGVQLWPTTLDPDRGRYKGELVNGVYPQTDDFATAITIDPQGNVYVTGASEGKGTGWDYVTIKYNPDGDCTPPNGWVANYNYNEATDNMAGNRHDFPSAIAVDNTGKVYVTGSSWRSRKVGGEVYNNYDYATVKYQATGEEIRVKRWDGAGNGSHDYASALAVDNQTLPNVYVTGSSRGATSGYDYVTIAYTSSGAYLWDPAAKRYDGLSDNSHSYAKAIAVDNPTSLPNVFVTGLSFKDGESANYATVIYPPGGIMKERSVNGPANGWDEPAAIVADSQKSVHVTGSSAKVSSTDYRTIRYRYDGDRNFVGSSNWYPELGSSSPDGATAMAKDDQNNIYVTGFSTRSGWNMQCVTLKYAPAP